MTAQPCSDSLHVTCGPSVVYGRARRAQMVDDSASWHVFDGPYGVSGGYRLNRLKNGKLRERRDFDASSRFRRAGSADKAGLPAADPPWRRLRRTWTAGRDPAGGGGDTRGAHGDTRWGAGSAVRGSRSRTIETPGAGAPGGDRGAHSCGADRAGPGPSIRARTSSSSRGGLCATGRGRRPPPACSTRSSRAPPGSGSSRAPQPRL